MTTRLLLVVALVVCVGGGRGLAAGALDAARVRALIDAGKYQEAEAACQQAIAAIERERGPEALEIADALDLVIEARWQARRLTATAQESRALAERALNIKEARLPADDPRVAATLVNVGVVRTAARDTNSARPAFERAIAIFERIPGPDSIEYARALATLAWSHWQARRLTLAQEVGERALALTRKAEQPAGRETSAILNTLAGIARVQKDPEKSLRLHEEALEIDERVNGVDHPANAFTLIGLSGAADDLGELQRSLDAQIRAVRIIEKTPGSERRLAFELLALASKLEHYGDYATALTYAERGLAVAERTSPPGSALHTAALDEMASLQDLLGDHASAATLRAKTIALWSGIQADSVHMATALNALATSYEEAGQLDRAFETIERGLQLKALEKSESEHARLLLTFGQLLEKRGRFDEARKALERALELEKHATTDAQTADAGMYRVQLARVERHDGHLDRALTLFREAIAESTRQLGSDHIRTAEQQLELAKALAEHGDLAEAREAMVQAEEASLAHLRLVARTLPDRRALAFAAGRESGVDLAITLATAPARKNATNSAAAGNAASAGRRASAGGAAGVAARAGVAGAAGVAAAGAVTAESKRADAIETAWQLVIRGRTVVLDEMAARQRTVVAESNLATVREQWTALNRARARLATLIVNGPEGLEAEEYLKRVEEARLARDGAERALALTSVSFKQEQERTHAGVREVLARLPKGAVLVSFVRYTPQLIRGGSRGGGPRGGGAAIATRAEAVAQGAPAYAAFVARAGHPVRIISLGRADEIDAAIGIWRERIQAELQSAGLASRRGEAAYREAGQRVRAKLWDPLRAHIGIGVNASGGSADSADTQVFVVPDAAIHLVDFSTLPIGTNRYLVDAPIALHYLLAERDLVEPRPEPQGNSLLALGGPDFDRVDRAAVNRATPASAPAPSSASASAPAPGSAPASGSAPTRAPESTPAAAPASANAAAPAAAALRHTRSACDAFAERRFTPLPATLEEAQHIAKLWHLGADPKHTVEILRGAEASEAAFKAMAPGQRVLHLATHGFFLDRTCDTTNATSATNTISTTNTTGATTGTRGTPLLEESPLLRSGLVLAGANQRATADADDEDGILTAEEIAGLNLSATEWAVLSACDTGRGDWQPNEGVLGLRRAFEVAGARTVIISLWPVIDSVASQWMEALYREKFVNRADTAIAIRAASRKLLAAQRAAGRSTHPLYWTGFIATGDWR
jgi:tetratricopeptide (TPR) repeat protein